MNTTQPAVSFTERTVAERTSTEKIRTGLDEPPPLPPEIADAPITEGAVADIAKVAEGHYSKFARRLEKLNEQAEAAAAELEERLGRLSLTPEVRRDVLARETAQVAKSLLEATNEERWQILKEMQALSDQVALVAPLFASPQAMLSRAGLDSPRRSAYAQNLLGAGPVELRNAAILAIATKDLELGAAVQAVIDRTPKRDRSVSAAELASRLVGDKHREVSNAITVVRNRLQEAVNLNREFQAGRSSPLNRIKAALNRRREQK